MKYEKYYQELEQYLATGEPEVEQRARNWSIAIGLQDVDRLKPSEFLLAQAKANIEGKISSEEVNRRLEEYYSQKIARGTSQPDDAMEADQVAGRINVLLEEGAFTFSPMELVRIHKALFKGLLSEAGNFRTYNFTKKQWILDGDSVTYGHYDSISNLLAYDFDVEKNFDYSKVNAVDAIANISRFISSIWQIHAFGEGNTRTTAVFLIKYLRSFGFTVNNMSFERHSWYFRNALVRSQFENIPKGVYRTFEPLLRFMNFAVFGHETDLRNRTLHIHWEEAKRQHDVNATPKRQNGVTETPHLLSLLSLKESAIVRLMIKEPNITISAMASSSGLSRRTIDRIVAGLKEKGILTRSGSRAKATWHVTLPEI